MTQFVATMPFPVLEPENITDPYPIYAQMRAESPLAKMPYKEMGTTPWLLTRYDDCIALQSDKRFTKEWGKLDTSAEYAQSPAAMINRHMLMLDPPDHTRLRGLVHMAFTPKIISAMNDRIQVIADDLIDAMIAKGEGDFIADYALPLPITVIAELLGIPAADHNKFRGWSQTIVMDGLKGTNPDAVAAAAMEFIFYFHDMFDQRRAEPKDDLLSSLVQVEEAGDKLDPQELISMIFLLLVAGHETTVNLIGNGALTLLRHPDQLALLRANPTLIKSAVEEMLRYEGPVSSTTMRWALEDIEMHGLTIQRGDMVLASLLSADRDDSQFVNADTFDIRRTPNKHIAFGNGIHYCLGAPLARMEGAIAINTLINRIPHLAVTVADEDLKWNTTLLLRGMKHMPVTYA